MCCILSGTKRFDSEKAGDREVQRTMLELLNQMDGFQPNAMIKVSNSVDLWNCPCFAHFSPLYFVPAPHSFEKTYERFSLHF